MEERITCDKRCRFYRVRQTDINKWQNPAWLTMTAECGATGKTMTSIRRKFVLDSIDNTYETEAKITATEYAGNLVLIEDCLAPEKRELVG